MTYYDNLYPWLQRRMRDYPVISLENNKKVRLLQGLFPREDKKPRFPPLVMVQLR